jgi:hypothetical protein
LSRTAGALLGVIDQDANTGTGDSDENYLVLLERVQAVRSHRTFSSRFAFADFLEVGAVVVANGGPQPVRLCGSLSRTHPAELKQM